MPTYDEFMRLAEERDRYRHHSIKLNLVAHNIGVALGLAEQGEDFDGDPEDLAAQLIADRDGFRRQVETIISVCRAAEAGHRDPTVREIMRALVRPVSSRVRLDLGNCA